MMSQDNKRTKTLEEFSSLKFHVVVSVKYHTRRIRYFENVQNTTLFVAFIYSTVAFTGFVETIFGEYAESALRVAGFIVSMFVGISIVGRIGTKANDHSDLRRRFIRLQQKMEAVEDVDKGNLLKDCWDERLSIEKDEPTINRVVHALAYNETVKSLSIDDTKKRYVKILWRHRLLGWMTRAFDSSLELAPANSES